ncbi:MAG: RdgB/HAM1 family non-canonical purine NTP pyrophosphatase [Clostridiales bacterium]|nr:RdgB/HAM1 family non-canonical purine NTP pyrophosphatase [Clostridiales bacterium]
MKFLIATHNRKKLSELKRILEPLGIEAVIASDIGMDISDPEETGLTFAENAKIKAACGCGETGLPCIADDSGLCIDALDGRPGVFSARYAGGHDTPYSHKMQVILDEMKDVADEDRTARFVSAVCCVFPDGREINAEGKCEGKIGYEPLGCGGFGYDPIFMVGDKSFAQLTDSEKDAVSHRGNALRLFVCELQKWAESEKL